MATRLRDQAAMGLTSVAGMLGATMRQAQRLGSLLWPAFVVLWFGVLAWASVNRTRSESLLVDAQPDPMTVIAGLLSLGYLGVAVRETRRLGAGLEAFTARRVGPIVVYLVQAAGFILLGLGTILVIAARAGHTIAISPAQSEVTEGELFEALMWQMAAAVPLMDLPTSVGWENPIPDPAWPLGLANLAIRVVFGGVLAWAAALLWRTWRQQQALGQGLATARS